ncbi:MAG: M23 family metallopeptidase [Bacteroidia bacterium]|nr:M23 family metallopeptidase [Bacteroidia bacterium]
MKNCWNSRLSKFVFFFSSALALNVQGQFSPPDRPLKLLPAEKSYLFPIKPGQANFLAGTMGELRNTHFHGGIDVRTNNLTGIPVLATQDGFVSHATISSFGYGNVLFITHPDGNTSVYGHLDKFNGALAQFVKQEQYRRKTFEIDLFFKPDQYLVDRGDTIGFSGNTGGSNGAHLHFEIRNENNEALNSLTFGFTEIQDNRAPVAQKIALKTLDINSRINDRFGRFEFYVVKSGDSYVLPKNILAYGRIGVELLAIDKMDNSSFRFGINHIEMKADSQRIFSQHIEKLPLAETRGILALMDYKTLKTTGTRFNKLYIGDGNSLKFYDGSINSGEVFVAQKDIPVSISLVDANKNQSTIKFRLRPSLPVSEVKTLEAMTKDLSFDILENTLAVSTKPCSEKKSIAVFVSGVHTEVSPSYFNSSRNVYLFDLQKVMPDSVQSCKGSLAFNFKDIVPSQTEYTYYSDLVDIKFPENALYDTLFLNVNRSAQKDSEIFTIGNKTTPLHRVVDITLRPLNNYSANRNTGVYRTDAGRYSYIGGEWSNGKVKFSARELGDFVILQDSVPPTLTKVYCHNSSARFRIRDGLSGIGYFEATINGKWLLMVYDYKTGIVQSDRLDKTQSLKGDFELKVVDNAGNEKIYKQKIL